MTRTVDVDALRKLADECAMEEQTSNEAMLIAAIRETADALEALKLERDVAQARVVRLRKIVDAGRELGRAAFAMGAEPEDELEAIYMAGRLNQACADWDEALKEFDRE